MIKFDSKKHSQILQNKITTFVSENNVTGKLLIIIIGSDPASIKYVGLKEKFCNKFGIPVRVVNISENLSDAEIFNQVETLFNDEEVTGGIIQLPLPRESLNNVLDLIPAEKDIDCISTDKNSERLSPVVRSTKYFLDINNIQTKGLKVGLIGNGYLVGQPVGEYLTKSDADVTIVNNYGKGTKLDFDLVVSSTGVPKLVKPSDIGSNCSFIDFGSSVLNDKVVGDLDLSEDINHLGFVATSPGGLGPLVVRFLIMNFLGI